MCVDGRFETACTLFSCRSAVHHVEPSQIVAYHTEGARRRRPDVAARAAAVDTGIG